jgi:hypothetical protein
LADTWNGGMPLLNRLQWARLDSLLRCLLERMMVRLTAEPYHMQATAQKLKRLAELNALRTVPMDLNKRILGIASRSVHNAIRHEARADSQEVADKVLHNRLVVHIGELSRIMQANIVE